MAAWKLLCLQTQALSRNPTLELVREEPIIAPSEDNGRDIWPARQRKARLEE
jgi:hypothetical protein